MTKRYDDPIEVTPDPIDVCAPLSFLWRGRRYDIDQRLESWREEGRWWASKEATDREFFRVLARPAGALASGEVDADGFMVSPGAVYDLYRDRLQDEWKLARVWD